ncbi:tetratricopeptide repeat protein [Aquabacter spiritensis]|uniref:Tetratricopeptide repeat protein n=1 Tax=Aquabacter spiritensis TaxID=933073 RepID=A0A4R3M3Y6_9HYPH|nr:tetratricopeptide repeat protein [Aquabacter spiritensis]TCT07516.1 tetratricopeptide repeat protein [Aquabacter spiritensis]
MAGQDKRAFDDGPAPGRGAGRRGIALACLLGLVLAACAGQPEAGLSPAETGSPAETIAYSKSLADRGQREQAAAVLRIATLRNPDDRPLRAAYGKSLIALGRYREAGDVLAQAHTPDNPDWSVLSAQGVVADNLGDHRSARAFYQRALNLNPGNPGVLTNLALSYAMSGDRAAALKTLREAAARPDADARVRQSLATLLAMDGKDREAELLFLQDLPPDQARANIDYLRRHGS